VGVLLGGQGVLRQGQQRLGIGDRSTSSATYDTSDSRDTVVELVDRHRPALLV
jgi:hypothetical protein